MPMPETTNPFSLKEKIILITGASSGIGKQCAISCSQMGANIIGLGRNEERLKETLDLCSNPGSHFIYSVDLTDYEMTREKIDEILSNHTKIDGMINSAGISTTSPFKLSSPDKMEHFIQTNVTSALNLVRLAHKKKLLNPGSSIVFLASVMGMVGEIGKTMYGMTKGALIAATKSMALEFASKNIRVNCLSPGVVETPLSKKSYYSQDEKLLEHVKSNHPLGLGKPEDIALACIYLLSDASSWMTGANIPLDGGYTAR